MRKQENKNRKGWSRNVGIGAVIIMIAVCPLFRPKGTSQKDPFETMNHQLDSLVETTYGTGVILDDLSPIETVTQRDSLNSRLSVLNGEEKIQRDLGKLLGKTPELYYITEEIDRLKEELQHLKGNGRFTYSRRIYLTLPDGNKMTGFQQSNQELTQGSLVNMTAIPENTESLQQTIENKLGQQNPEKENE